MQNHCCHDTGDFQRRFRVSLALTVPVLALSPMIREWFHFALSVPFQNPLLFLFSTVIFVYGGWPFLKGTVDEVRNRLPGMMTLIGFAVTVAWVYSSATVFRRSGHDFFWELATLIDIMLIGHWIEARSTMGASRAIEELVRVLPARAHLLKDGVMVDVPISDVREGDIAAVLPGEKIPADGSVVEGESFLNESFLTGESKPVHRKTGDFVIGGAVNGSGSLRMRVEKTGERTYLARVIRLVNEARESRSRTQDLADRAAALLFYVALISGIATFIVWAVLAGTQIALERFVTVLVISCPHALGLAIPLVVAISTAITARNGILIRKRSAFEAAGKATAVVFDKTGTLTEGVFGVSDVIALVPEDTLIALTAALEARSEHPVARGIMEYARGRLKDVPEARDVQAIPGKGIGGTVRGKKVRAGGWDLLEDAGILMLDKRIDALREQEKTLVFVLVDGSLAGVFALADRIRAESREAVASLKKAGMTVYMLTGDSAAVARGVSHEVGIDEFFARILPDRKAEKIRMLKEKGFRVAMVGDGINDAPALLTADVGIAIGAGTDAAIESADIVLVRNDPRDVARIVELSRKTYAKMVQNLWWAAGYNALSIPLAAGVLAGIGVTISPAAGAVLMSASTVIVALNAQLLRRSAPPSASTPVEKTVKDPVCGMSVVPATAAATTVWKGRTIYYFCSESCREEYLANPARYS